MNTRTIRLNITLPKNLVDSLNRLTEPRKRSRFIAKAIKIQIEQKEKKELNEILEQGYQAARHESLELVKEFENVDLEGWDDY